MAALFAKLIASPSFLVGAGPSKTHAATWCRFLGLVKREFSPDAFCPGNCLGVSKPKANHSYPNLRLPPNTASTGESPRQWHSLPRMYISSEGTCIGRKKFQQERSYQALAPNLTHLELRRGVGDKFPAPGYGQALWFSSAAKRQFSTTPETGAAKKLCSVCNHEKPFRNFEATQASADGLHSLCRACLATLRAKRCGRPLYHLSLSVEEAWERAQGCSCCEQRQELREFGRDAREPDGTRTKCRSCEASYTRRRPRRAPSTQPKECSICGVMKPAADFHATKRDITGLHPYCKSCHKNKVEGWACKVKGSMLTFPAATKWCHKCGEEKSRSEFHGRKLSPDGLQVTCKECRKESRSQ